MIIFVECSICACDEMVELPEKARALIDGRNFANIATLMKDGSPHVTVTWVAREGNTVIINTTKGRVKTKNVLRDPRVALSIFSMNDPYDAVFIRGRVVEVTDKGAEEHVDVLAHKYIGTSYREHGDRVILKIEPLHVYLQKP